MRCAAAVVPFISLPKAVDAGLVVEVAQDLAARAVRRRPRMVKVTDRPGERAAMNSDGAWEWAQEMTADAPRYRNEVTTASLLNMARWSTRKQAANVQVPVRVVLAEADTITPAAMVRRALSTAPRADIVSFPETHFELFREHRQDTIDAIVSGLAQHL